MDATRNKLVADFMKYLQISNNVYQIPKMVHYEPDFDNRTTDLIDTFSIFFDEMEFHSNWNWLMEVVDKIESLTDKENYILYDFTIFPDAVRVSNREDETLILINKNEGEFTTKIEAVYLAVVKFIEWYNFKIN